ncbi:HD domain-containing protein [Candidatus Electronema sp. PJ]|uniref:HD domain-containing protein n=1 Tax=Candidatus Electronema sp. PJ TaxID=3401572 RepID=UPI003AA823A2
MNIPDIAACAALMDQHGMLANIRAHSVMVARIAGLLAEGLSKTSQQPPDLQLCLSGALLHDIAKTSCLRSGDDHAKAGAAICLKEGFPEIATIVAGHVILPDFAPARYRAGIFSANEIIYYADKRVLHDNIVSLAERLEYILDKYGRGEAGRHELIQDNFRKCSQLEEWLFSFLDFAPEELAERTAARNSLAI